MYDDWGAGLLRQPKWGHLADLHKALRMCEKPLLYGEATTMPLGPSREVKHFLFKLFILHNLENRLLFIDRCLRVHWHKNSVV